MGCEGGVPWGVREGCSHLPAKIIGHCGARVQGRGPMGFEGGVQGEGCSHRRQARHLEETRVAAGKTSHTGVPVGACRWARGVGRVALGVEHRRALMGSIDEAPLDST